MTAATARRPLPFRVGDLLRLSRILAVAVVVELGLRVVPLDRLGPRLGVHLQPPRGSSGGHPFTERERRDVRAARALMRRWPFADGSCLRLALLAGHLLRRHHPVLRIGVARSDGELQAHAWIEVGDVIVGTRGAFSPFDFAVRSDE